MLLFALFHDAMRANEDSDPRHGERGAALAAEFGPNALGLSAGQMQQLERACRDHTGGGVSADPTIGVCWDADRLTLGRVGITPKARYFSTDAGRKRLGTNLRGDVPDWSEIGARAVGL